MNKHWPIIHRRLSMGSITMALVLLPFSVTWCHAALLSFIVFWIAEGGWKEKFSVVAKSTILQLLLLLAVVQLAGVFYSENQERAWFSLEKKIFFFLIPIALAATNVRWTEKEVRTTFYCFVASCFLGVCICLAHAGWQTWLYGEGLVGSQSISYLSTSSFENLNPSAPVIWLFFSYVGLSEGISIHPSYFSLYLAFCVVFLLHELLTGKQQGKLYYFINCMLVLLFTIFIICLSSRIMVFSLITIYISIILFYIFFSQQQKTVSVIFIGMLVVVLILLQLNPVSRYRNIQEITSTSLDIKNNQHYKTSTEIRASLWWLGWKSYVKTNLLLGTGTGDVTSAMKETAEAHNITNVLGSYDPHSQYLFLLIGNGIAGLVIFLLILFVALLRSLSSGNWISFAFIFLFASLCVTETALELQKGVAFFAVTFTLLSFQWQGFQPQKLKLTFASAGN